MVIYEINIRFKVEKHRSTVRDRSCSFIKLSCSGDLMCSTGDYYITLNIIFTLPWHYQMNGTRDFYQTNLTPLHLSEFFFFNISMLL